jgi:hypothetical protein
VGSIRRNDDDFSGDDQPLFVACDEHGFALEHDEHLGVWMFV